MSWLDTFQIYLSNNGDANSIGRRINVVMPIVVGRG